MRLFLHARSPDEATPRHVARCWPVPAIAVACILGITAPALAGEGGFFRPRTPAVTAPAPANAASDAAASAEDEAQELYVDALDTLDDGNRALAARLLNTVVARFPGTAAAEKARRQLAEIDVRPDAKPVARPAVAAVPPSAVAGVNENAPGASAPAPVAAHKPAPPRPMNNSALADRFRLDVGDRVFFAADSAEIGARARAALAAQAKWLKRWPDVTLVVDGHADEPGNAEHNRRLSQERADAVRRRLVEEGVETHRISIVAHGRNERIAPCADTACAAQNRRVVTNVYMRDAGHVGRVGVMQPASGTARDAGTATEPRDVRR